MKAELYTPTQVNALSSKDLVAYHNSLVAEASRLGLAGFNETKRFSTASAGRTRVLKLLEQVKKATKAADANKPSAGKAVAPRTRRGTNLIPFGHAPEPCREGSKQAALLDALKAPDGATMAELKKAMSGGNKPWTEVTIRSGFGWDLRNKGYGVRSEFDDKGVERFFLVLPEKYKTVPAHTPLKTAKPKAHAAQSKLALSA